MSEQEWLDIFGKNLLDAMREKGYTQRDLAEATDLSEGTISSYVRGHKLPGVRAIINIAYELDMDVGELIDFGERIDYS